MGHMSLVLQSSLLKATKNNITAGDDINVSVLMTIYYMTTP